MQWPMYISWLLGPSLESILLALMVRHRLQATFPRFFSYIVFQLVEFVSLFFVYHFNHANYFNAFWTGNAVSVLISVAVLDEIWHRLFRGYEGIQGLGLILFRWACALMLLIAIVGVLPYQQSGADRVAATVLALDRSMRLMQCGLFFLVLLLCRSFKNFWRDHIFGIALGFGVVAIVEIGVVTSMARFGMGHSHASASLINAVAYNVVLLLWIGYLRQPNPVVIRTYGVDEISTRNTALVTEPASYAGGPFLNMVEGAVERVLSRTAPWPKPPNKGSHVVSRKPDREDCN